MDEPKKRGRKPKDEITEKPVAKKRGRKPKIGKIITNIENIIDDIFAEMKNGVKSH